ncbi:MAG: MFS transporter [Acidimicrobiia bacterium]|nr:MAG: MFS transporter [Acidimicrobiia bacterium]
MEYRTVSERGVVASVLPLFAGLALLMIGDGLLGSLLGIRADIEGFPIVVIGVVMAMYYGGFLLGSLTIPRWLVAVGHIRVFAGLAALAGATALSYALSTSPLTWGVLRFVAGLSMSGLYVTVESWLNDRASNETRGRLLSVYMVVVTLGLSFGQILLGLADPSESTLFILVGILISLAVVPIALIRIPAPTRTIPVEFSVRALAHAAPLGVVVVVLTGAAGSSVLALGAVYATNVGMEPGRVGVFMASSLVGAVLTQYPIGYISDRFPRRRVILIVAAGAVVSAIVAVTVDSGSPWLFVLMGVYGSLAIPMYSLAVSLINDAIPEIQLVATAAGIIFVYGIGSILGPLAVSGLMAVVGPVGYLWGLAAFFMPVVVYALGRIIFNARPGQGPFISLPARSSTAAALLAEPSDDEQ